MQMVNERFIVRCVVPFIITFFISSFFVSCTSTKNNGTKNLRRVDLYFNLPIVTDRGDLINISDSLVIFYNSKSILYRIPYRTVLIDSGEMINEQIKYNYFIYHKKESKGFFFDSVNVTGYKKIKVDSFLGTKALLGFEVYNKTNDSLVETINDNENFNLIQKFVPKVRIDESYPDTTIVYYKKKFHDLEISFSQALERSNSLQISKVKMLYVPHVIEKSAKELPYRELYVELKELSNILADEVFLFNLLEQKISKSHLE
jgi:hypothetical protein